VSRDADFNVCSVEQLREAELGAAKSFKPHRSEYDPNGIIPGQPGAKLDAGKQRAGLVLGDFSRALSAVCDVGTFGATKYSDRGWMAVPNGISRYFDAGCRHFLKRCRGEECDQDSGLLHLAHEAWNKLAELELRLKERENVESMVYDRACDTAIRRSSVVDVCGPIQHMASGGVPVLRDFQPPHDRSSR